MLIGELAIRTGFSRDTIRFYEKHGLIKVPRRSRRENNYKEYSEDILERLLTIKRVKEFGFTLNETSEILDLMEMKVATCDNIALRIEEKVKIIDERIRLMLELRQSMLTKVSECFGKCGNSETDNCAILLN
ncbi:MAG: MerR family transcriptional regulator [Bacteroidetes bacterium]|nr:MerR family transcriptional regulator [Bacteroidota bacterium]